MTQIVHTWLQTVCPSCSDEHTLQCGHAHILDVKVLAVRDTGLHITGDRLIIQKQCSCDLVDLFEGRPVEKERFLSQSAYVAALMNNWKAGPGKL